MTLQLTQATKDGLRCTPAIANEARAHTWQFGVLLQATTRSTKAFPVSEHAEVAQYNVLAKKLYIVSNGPSDLHCTLTFLR